MRNVLRQSSGLCILLLGLLMVPVASAANQALQAAKKQFTDQQYGSAQVALRNIADNQLSPDEQAERTRLLKEVEQAIAASQQAETDRQAADRAFDAARWDEADRLYRGILSNRYALQATQIQAAVRHSRIVEKQRMGAAQSNQPAPPARTSGRTQLAADEQMQEVGATPRPAGTPAPTQTAMSGQSAVEVMPQPADDGRPLTIIDEMRRKDELFWQRAVAQMNKFADEARQQVLAGDFVAARRLADSAFQSIEAARIYASPASRYETARAAAEALQLEVGAAQDEADRLAAAEQQAEIKRAMEVSRTRQEAQKAAQIDQMLQTIETLGAEYRFEEAVDVIRQILVLDPGNKEANYLLGHFQNFVSFKSQSGLTDRRLNATRDTLAESDGLLIPPRHDMTYPENWVELSERRGNLGRSTRGDQHEQRVAMERRLQRAISEFAADELTLMEIVELLRERYGVDIRVDEALLEDFGVDLQALLTINMRDTTILDILQEVVKQAGGFDVDLALDMGAGYVEIKPRDELTVYGRSYDVQHVIPRDPIELDQGGGQGGGLTGGSSSQQNDEDWEEIRDRIDETVIPQIQSYTPGIWEDPEGVAIDVSPPRHVVVSQTYEGHKAVEEAVRNLGDGGSGPDQVAFEARFLTITSNFLEQIGVDLDFVFNQGTAGFDQAFTPDGGQVRDAFTGAPVLINRQYSQAGFYATPPALGTGFATGAVPAQPYGNAAFVPSGGGVIPAYGQMTPIPMAQNSLDLATPAGLATGVPGSLNQLALPAMSIAGSFLDNLQVDFLIRATQANKRSSVVQAPRLLIAEGQTGQIRIVRQFQTISNLEGAVGENTGIAAPGAGQTQSVQQGVVMTLRNVRISPNRQYVTSQINISNNGEPIITPFTVQRASGNSPGLTIEKYEQDQNTISTVASIPDGGTALLGGIKRVGEAEIDVGVPILSKIPILKRAFANTATVKDTQTIFVLLKASILVPEEAELEAFPVLGSTGGGL